MRPEPQQTRDQPMKVGLETLEHWVGALLVLMLLAMVALTFTDVLGRRLLNW